MLSLRLSQSESFSSKSIPLFIALLASVVAAVPFAIDMYLPAMQDISAEFDTPMTMVQMTLSTFLIGYALGQLALGPLADVIGKRPILLMGLSGYCLCSLVLSMATNIEQFLAIRFVQAFIGAGAVVPIAGYVKIIYGQNVSKGMSYVGMIMMMAPMIAPTLGIGFMYLSGWRLIFVMLAAYAGIIATLCFFALPKVDRVPLSEPLTRVIFKTYKLVFSEPKVRRYLMMICFVSFSFFCYLTAIPFVYMTVYGVSEGLFGFLFGVNVGMFILGSFVNTRIVGRFGSMKLAKIGLTGAVIAAVLLVTVNHLQLHLYWTVFSLAFYLFSLIILSVNLDALMVLAFPQNPSTASGVGGTVRFGCGGLAGPVLALFPSDGAMPFTYLILGAIVMSGICLFWPQSDEVKA